MKKLLLAFSLTLLLSACSSNEPVVNEDGEVESNAVDIQVDNSDWVPLQSDGFYVLAPEGWTLTPEQGIDSYVATISGDGLSLTIDYGALVGNPFESQTDLAASQENIDGIDSIVYLPRTTVEGTIGLYMPVSSSSTLTITGDATSREERLLFLEIVRSVELE